MPPKLDCPEVELRHSASSQAQVYPPYPDQATSVDLLEIYDRDVESLQDGSAKYEKGLDHEDLVKHLKPSVEKKPILRILFVHGLFSQTRGKPQADPSQPALGPSTVQYLIEHLGVSPAFMAVLTYKTLITKTGNCLRVKRPRSGTGSAQPRIEGWYRYSCELQGLPSHVWFSYTAETATYIVNNCEHNGVQETVVRCVNEGMGAALLRPMALDGFIAEAISVGWGNEVLKPRSILVEYEHLDRTTMFQETSESIRELHIVSYNLLIIKEDMIDHIERLKYLSTVRETLSSTFGDPDEDGVDVTHTFSFLLSETQIRRRWVQSYADRIGIQINLFYNLSAQRDNRTNLRIADFTSKIATETQKDSSSMITMAAVTMFFLPGTFVSAIFSMVFFESSGGMSPTGLSVTKGWWLFPVITIPLTILVFTTWNIWRIRRNQLQVKDLQHLNSYPVTQIPPRPQTLGISQAIDFSPPIPQPFMPVGTHLDGQNSEKKWADIYPPNPSPPDPPTVRLPLHKDVHPHSIAFDRTPPERPPPRSRRRRSRSSYVSSRLPRPSSKLSPACAPEPLVLRSQGPRHLDSSEEWGTDRMGDHRMRNLSIGQPAILVADLPSAHPYVR